MYIPDNPAAILLGMIIIAVVSTYSEGKASWFVGVVFGLIIILYGIGIFKF